MRQLPIDLDELVECMQQHFDEAGHYLDKQTGEIELVDESFVRQIEDGEEDEGAEFDGPDWEKELLPIAQAVAVGDERYVPLPEPDPHEHYQRMVRFAAGVEDPHARQRLEDALDGRGAFGRFRRVLSDHPELRDQWHARQIAAMRERALECLAELGIEAVRKPKGG